MPKIVDHEERRKEISEATWRVIVREGVEGVSIRDVAAEAGLSTGALRHYFANKEELLAGATRRVVERVVGRLDRGPSGKTPQEAVRAVLCEILPLDEERTTEAAVWLAFAARSLVDRRVAEEHEMVFDGVRELCRRVTQELAARGKLAPGLDSEKEASLLHALVDGLCVHLLMGTLDPEGALVVLDEHLARIVLEEPADVGERSRK